ncbi:sulfate transporter [Rubrivivax gelatinosus]|uniref:DUF3164 family protein n=1 Tax=Rubrivivax gelatinosus TaxID=28068 RepID=UPI001906CEC4|nr:DUF3164 family protein [Rubrivivax gelatinosus]MBK1614979.1 sulfate transporter [Rubrivivax gelatinosus]MBZ8142971.1 sulfate transporter [Rubrivivax gelatinosus]
MDTTTVPKGYWQDASGNLVPIAKIKPLDKQRQALAEQLTEQAKAMQKQLRAFKLDAMAAVAGFVSDSAAQYGVKVGGEKGNVTIVSFDGRFKIIRQVQETLAFDERLQVAKEIIDECVHAWAKGANRNIQALVNHAFQVDSAGKVSTSRVLGLRQLKIDDERWRQAMDAIADSMRVAASKSYVRFYERDDKTGEYVAIPLDVSAL